MKNWELTTLPNGLRIVTTPMPTTQAVSVNIFVGVGSRSEPQRINGITHFLEHMVFKGTEKRPDATMIAQEIEGAGGTLNAYTNKEYTCYWNIVPFDRFDTALDVEADMLLCSKLEQAEIDRERTVVQQELKRNHDNPAAWAGRLIGTSVYGEQPAGWDVGGSVELVEAMQRPDFVSHIGEWYLPSNIVLSVAGNVTHADVVRKAEPLFSGMKPGTLPGLSPYDPAMTGPRVATDSRDIDQCTLYLGLPIFGRDDPDRFSLRIMNDVLGAGMSSRLFREVRERRGLAYSVGVPATATSRMRACSPSRPASTARSSRRRSRFAWKKPRSWPTRRSRRKNCARRRTTTSAASGSRWRPRSRWGSAMENASDEGRNRGDRGGRRSGRGDHGGRRAEGRPACAQA